MSTEAFEEHQSIRSVARLEDYLLMTQSGFRIEDTFLFEKLPCISFKNLTPEIGIIAGCIAVIAEDMLEIR